MVKGWNYEVGRDWSVSGVEIVCWIVGERSCSSSVFHTVLSWSPQSRLLFCFSPLIVMASTLFSFLGWSLQVSLWLLPSSLCVPSPRHVLLCRSFGHLFSLHSHVPSISSSGSVPSHQCSYTWSQSAHGTSYTTPIFSSCGVIH